MPAQAVHFGHDVQDIFRRHPRRMGRGRWRRIQRGPDFVQQVFELRAGEQAGRMQPGIVAGGLNVGRARFAIARAQTFPGQGLEPFKLREVPLDSLAGVRVFFAGQLDNFHDWISPASLPSCAMHGGLPGSGLKFRAARGLQCPELQLCFSCESGARSAGAPVGGEYSRTGGRAQRLPDSPGMPCKLRAQTRLLNRDHVKPLWNRRQGGRRPVQLKRASVQDAAGPARDSEQVHVVGRGQLQTRLGVRGQHESRNRAGGRIHERIGATTITMRPVVVRLVRDLIIRVVIVGSQLRPARHCNWGRSWPRYCCRSSRTQIHWN